MVRTAVAALAVLLAALAGSAALAGQAGREADRSRGVIAGAIIDAVNGAPIEGATVVLQPEVLGAFPGPATGSAFAAATRSTMSDSVGGYRFDGLPAGVYRVYVSRFSYRPYSVVIELPGATVSKVSVGLGADPIALSRVEGRGHSRGPYETAHWLDGELDLARLLATDLRRRRHLTTDVRELTHADVVEAVTLGEPDLFRALQRLPGVTTRSDYTAELWTRGAPWSHTRVYFDGVPLFNPLHALGIISGISSSATGAVWFHPGVRSAGIGEGAAGVVDLQSRRAAGGGEVNVHGDLSVMSAGLALDQRVLDGRAGWMLAGRRTYLDWLSEMAGRAAGRDHESFPYGFGEVAGRVDAWIGDASHIEASWLWERDHLASEGGAALDPMRAEWGNTVGRATWTTRGARLNTRHGIGISRHDGLVRADLDAGTGDPEAWAWSETAVGYAALTGSFWPEPASLAGPAWTVGYALEHHAVDYFGPMPLPVPRSSSTSTRPASVPESDGTFSSDRQTWWTSSLPVAAAWGERTWSPDDRLAVRAGLRIEASDALRNAGAIRPAPRVSVRYSPAPELAVSAGYGRVFQYTQALAPGGVHLASLASTDVWVVAGGGVPVLRSDILTGGVEGWLAPGRVVALNVFGRQAVGVAMPDPRPGPVFGRTVFMVGENVAYGLEASARQLVGPVTGSASYTWTRSGIAAAGMSFPAAADRTHVFNATTMLRLLPAHASIRLGAGFTAATGVPYTRTLSTAEECAAFPGCDPDWLPWAGEPHALRAPTYASLDLLLDWSTAYRGVEFGLYVQLRNALGRDNVTVYTGRPSGCVTTECDELHNHYERGIPRLPVVGIRVRR